ncbi:MAG: TlpA disulfide reductase family protein [bacterium]
MKNYIKIFLLFTFISSTIIFSQNKDLKNSPNFILDDINGRKIELIELLNKGPIVISFWATWCKPCMDELKEYKKVQEELNNNNITFIAISIDDEKSISKVKPFIKSNNFNFLTLLDPNKDAARKYSVQTIPYTFILDKTGQIVYNHLGFKKGDELKLKAKLIELSK